MSGVSKSGRVCVELNPIKMVAAFALVSMFGKVELSFSVFLLFLLLYPSFSRGFLTVFFLLISRVV